MGGSMAEWESEKISYPIDMREGRGGWWWKYKITDNFIKNRITASQA